MLYFFLSVFRFVYVYYINAMVIILFLQAQQIVDKYLGKLNGSVSESVDNVNAVIVNTHFTFGDARPLPPGIVEVGGCTYKNPKPLSKVIYYTILNIIIL